MALGITIAGSSTAGWSLANVQRCDWSLGKQNLNDQYAGLTASLYGRSPSSFSPTPKVGDKVTWNITQDGTNKIYFGGFVADYKVRYGISSTYDTWEMKIDGAYNFLGRQYATINTTSGNSTLTMANAIATAGSTYVTVGIGTSPWGSTTSTQTITDSLAVAISTLMATEQGYIKEGSDPDLQLYGRSFTNSSTASFTDAGTAGYEQYDEIEFRSSADNYSTKVVVSAAGFADQTSGTGNYSANIDTINGSAAEALNLAGYIKTYMNLTTLVPYSLHFSGAVNQAKPSAIRIIEPFFLNYNVSIVFRGTTYECKLIGMDATADSTDWSATIYLVSSLASAFLILDSSVYGKLGTGKLGF